MQASLRFRRPLLFVPAPLFLRVGPLRARLTAADASSHEALQDVADAFGLPDDATSAPDLQLGIRRAESLPALPAGWDEVTRYGPEVRLLRQGDLIVVAGPDVRSTVNLAAGTAEIAAVPEARDGSVEGHLVVCLTLLLRPAGLYPLHAAGLHAGDDGVLLVGPSDVGKSTLAYNLVRAGWSFLSDDTVLLHHPAGGPVDAFAFRRRFALDADAGDRRPELAAQARPLPGTEAKWSVGVEALYPDRLAAQATPALLVFPELTGESASRVEPLAAGDAFVRLAAQSALRELADAHTRAHHEALGALLAQCRRVRLLAGLDLLDAPERAADLLNRALRDGVPSRYPPAAPRS
jgi:hypothetical protein